MHCNIGLRHQVSRDLWLDTGVWHGVSVFGNQGHFGQFVHYSWCDVLPLRNHNLFPLVHFRRLDVKCGSHPLPTWAFLTCNQQQKYILSITQASHGIRTPAERGE